MRDEIEYQARLRCNAAMGWTRWPTGAGPIGPIPDHLTGEDEVAYIADRLKPYLPEAGSPVWAYREKLAEEERKKLRAPEPPVDASAMPIPAPTLTESTGRRTVGKPPPWRGIVLGILGLIPVAKGALLVIGYASSIAWVQSVIAWLADPKNKVAEGISGFFSAPLWVYCIPLLCAIAVLAFGHGFPWNRKLYAQPKETTPRRPHFAVTVVRVAQDYHGFPKWHGVKGARVILAIKLINRGLPSAVVDWAVSIGSPSRQIKGQITPPSHLARFVRESHLSPVAPDAVGATQIATLFQRYDRESELTVLTPTTRKIAPGDIVEGFLLVEFPGVENFDETTLRRLTVQCYDFAGAPFFGSADAATICAQAMVEMTDW